MTAVTTARRPRWLMPAPLPAPACDFVINARVVRARLCAPASRPFWLRRISLRIAIGVRASLLGDRTPDTACGQKAFSRDLFLSM